MTHFQLFVAQQIYFQLRYWKGQLLLLCQHFLHLPFISISLASLIRYCPFFSTCSPPTSLSLELLPLLSPVIYQLLLRSFILLTIFLLIELAIILLPTLFLPTLFLLTLFLYQIVLASILFFHLSPTIFCFLFILTPLSIFSILYFMLHFSQYLTFLLTSFITFQARLVIFYLFILFFILDVE